MIDYMNDYLKEKQMVLEEVTHQAASLLHNLEIEQENEVLNI